METEIRRNKEQKMKRIVGLLSVAIMLMMTGGVASAGELLVYSGPIYDVLIEEAPQMDVGVLNPGGEDLIGFMLKIRNTTGDPGHDPYAFDGVTGTRLGLYTLEPKLHNQQFGSTPTLDEEVVGNVTATLIDTHFNFMAADVLFVGTAPSETNSLAPSVEPKDATGLISGSATVAFGDRLYGNFAVVGGAAADVDGDADPTTWELAWFAVPGYPPDGSGVTTTIYMNFFATSFDPGEVIVGSFTVPIVPEPATMSLLALGGIGALIRRRK